MTKTALVFVATLAFLLAVTGGMAGVGWLMYQASLVLPLWAVIAGYVTIVAAIMTATGATPLADAFRPGKKSVLAAVMVLLVVGADSDAGCHRGRHHHRSRSVTHSRVSACGNAACSCSPCNCSAPCACDAQKCPDGKCPAVPAKPAPEAGFQEAEEAPMPREVKADCVADDGATDALEIVNARRIQRGLRPYIRDDGLTAGAKNVAVHRARHRCVGHTDNDFSGLPVGMFSPAAGCGVTASPGWNACCTFDNYTHAGAASVPGPDGKIYHQIFVSNGGQYQASAMPEGDTNTQCPGGVCTGPACNGGSCCGPNGCGGGGRFIGRRR